MKNTDGMLCTLKSDLFKLKKHKSVWIGLAVMFGLILIAYCIFWAGMAIVNNMPAVDEDAIMVKEQLLQLLTPLGRTFLVGFSDTSSLVLFVAIITCLFVGKDFSNGAMRLTVSRGANRVHLYFSKWLCLALLIVAYSVFALLICGIFTSFKGYGIEFTGAQFGLLMRGLALQLLCNLSTMSIVLMLTFLCRSSGASLGATIGIYIVFSIIFSIATTVGAMSGGNTDWIMFMPLQQLSVASSLEKLSTEQLCAVIIMPLFYGGVATGIGLTSFLKRDIK